MVCLDFAFLPVHVACISRSFEDIDPDIILRSAGIRSYRAVLKMVDKDTHRRTMFHSHLQLARHIVVDVANIGNLLLRVLHQNVGAIC